MCFGSFETIGAMPRKLRVEYEGATWGETELRRRRKGDLRKARMAARLRAETTMTWPWIAQRLAMGHWRTALNATRLIVRQKR